MPLTSKYLHEHANAAQNYETIGREIAALILRTAANNMEENNLAEADELEVIVTVKLKQFEPLLCVGGEVCTPLGCIHTHFTV